MTGGEVLVQCPVLLVACDNPRASEFAHHMGSSALHFCRTCEVCEIVTSNLIVQLLCRDRSVSKSRGSRVESKCRESRVKSRE